MAVSCTEARERGKGQQGGDRRGPRLIAAHNLQDEGEDIDDVGVDGEGTVDVLLRA